MSWERSAAGRRRSTTGALMAIGCLAGWLAACAALANDQQLPRRPHDSTGDPSPTPGGSLDEPYPPAVPAAMQALAEEFGRRPETITVVRYEQADWPDACLGLPQEGEQCAQVVTPGWKVFLTLGGAEYELHTDEFGTQVRRR